MNVEATFEVGMVGVAGLQVVLETVLRCAGNNAGPQRFEGGLHDVEYLAADGIEPRLRNHVTGERITDVVLDGRIIARGGGIVDGVEHVRTIAILGAADGVAEVALIELGRRETDGAGAAGGSVAKTFVREEKEGACAASVQVRD